MNWWSKQVHCERNMNESMVHLASIHRMLRLLASEPWISEPSLRAILTNQCHDGYYETQWYLQRFHSPALSLDRGFHFSLFNRTRWLSKNYERLTSSSKAMVYLACCLWWPEGWASKRLALPCADLVVSRLLNERKGLLIISYLFS